MCKWAWSASSCWEFSKLSDAKRPDHARQVSPGHDQRLQKYAYEYVKGERELTEEQLSYVRDEINKLEFARARVEREEKKNPQKDES